MKEETRKTQSVVLDTALEIAETPVNDHVSHFQKVAEEDYHDIVFDKQDARYYSVPKQILETVDEVILTQVFPAVSYV